MCSGCGMVWEPGKFEEQYAQQELDLDYVGDDGGLYALEDADVDDPDFQPCPLCSSSNIVGLVNYSGDLAGRYMCRTCACEFTIHEGGLPEDEDDEEENLHAALLVCPHCAAINTIDCYGDNEWCNECWLDPNELTQDSPDIAKLFKGGIKHALERDIPLIKAEKPMGKFVRQECGPHCTYAKKCPMEVGNLVKCFREEFSSEEDVGKRRRGKKKNRKNRVQNLVKKHNKKHRHGPPKVAFFCAKGGLLEKMVLYGITDPNTESPGNTGSQSGA